MRDAICRLIYALLGFIVMLAFSFGVAVALVIIGAWAFGFVFSVRYAIALWSALFVLYALIRIAIPQKLELKGGEEEDD